ncbi:hypothetical protein C8Q76DRAFT_625928 [Earliella scabrosa]|nr:hypothetical protein C8Q76DRAFT_625928 [Earliella scabrosa]
MSRPRKDTSDIAAGTASREVNSLLHTLRGEHFRHSQNLRRSRAHLAAVASRTYNDPSLPFSDIYKYALPASQSRPRDREENVRPPRLVIHEGRLEYDYPRGSVPGPPVPRSWSGLFEHDPVEDRNTVAFRRSALSLVFSYIPWSFGSSHVPVLAHRREPGSTLAEDAQLVHQSLLPPLTQLCLRVLLAEFPGVDDFRDELLPILPPQFYRDVLRYTAVHDPLSAGKLYALCGPEGHVDGELIIVGPQASLQRDVLVSLSPTLPAHRGGTHGNAEDLEEGTSAGRSSEVPGQEPREEDVSWDAESSYSLDGSVPVHTLVVLNSSVPTTMLLIFPPTLTRLALLALSAPAQIHRLPRICPLLEVMDLSYNPWLNDPPGGTDAETILDRIEWEKWARLRVLGLRECSCSEGIVARVNKGRFEEDVVVIGVKERTLDISLSVVEGMMKSLRSSD